jgi:predicted transposase YbfD/YdcC
MQTLEDPRSQRNQRHLLVDVVSIALCGMISGADDWTSMEEFGYAKEQWFRSFLELPNGIPSHDTFRRLFMLMNTEHLERMFREWAQSIVTLNEREVVAIDGKCQRAARNKNTAKSSLHYMVNAWATDAGLALGQHQVDGKSNEAQAVRELLALLELSGCIVTLDAASTQKSTAQTILNQGADYVLAVKRNQPKLHDAIEAYFSEQLERPNEGGLDVVETDIESAHGRTEQRLAWVSDDLSSLSMAADWPGLQCIALVQSIRKVGSRCVSQHRLYMSSVVLTAEELLKTTRSHWGVENSLHWVLDVAFDEDRSRARTGYSAANLAVLRQFALNLLKQENSKRLGVKNKRKKAGWNTDYLLKVLAGESG